MGLIQGFAGHTAPGLNAIGSKMPFLLAVRAKPRWLVSAYRSEGGRVGPRLRSTCPVNRIFLLKAANDCVCPEGGGIHGGIKG